MGYKKGRFLFFFLIITAYNKPLYSHAVYVSVCNIYERGESSYFSIRAFKDDVFDALGYVGKSQELTEKEMDAIVGYIKKNFVIMLDGENKNLSLYRFVFEGSDYTETANVVFEIKESMSKKKLDIKNTILFDVLEDQTNIVGVKINNTRKTINFNQNKKTGWVLVN